MKPALLVLFALSLAACGPSRLERAQSFMANPASVNCTTRGGQLVVRQTASGQKGYCLLQDGRSIGVWEYYRQTNG